MLTCEARVSRLERKTKVATFVARSASVLLGRNDGTKHPAEPTEFVSLVQNRNIVMIVNTLQAMLEARLSDTEWLFHFIHSLFKVKLFFKTYYFGFEIFF